MKLFSISKKNKNKGSVLAYTMIVMFMLLTIALGISISAVKQRQGAITTTKSIQALQVAESGSQLSKKQIMTLRSTATKTLSNLATDLGGVCNGNTISSIPSAGGTYNLNSYKDDGSGGLIDVACGDALNLIKNIKIVSTAGGSTRAIKVEIPEPVPPSVSASSASAHSFAVKSDGTGWGWGFEVGKRLIAPNFVADYDRPRKTKPVVADFKQIVPGFGISLALDINGDVWSWGSESSGELGNGSFNTQNVDPPVKVSGISNIIQVATGGNNSMALDKDGFVWAWGENSRGQLGDKTTTDRATPSKVFDKDGNPLVNIVAISLGAFGGVNVFTHSLALDKNGFVWAWGDNNYGQLGNNQSPLWGNVDYVNYAVKVKDNTGAGSLSNIASISAGAGDSFAVEKTTGKVWSWGSDGNAGHGAGAACNGGGNPCFRLPGKVFDTTGSGEISNIKEISAGADHVLALDNSGKVLAWGKNSKGQLGQNNTNDSGFPIKVLDTSGSGELSDIGSITAGHSHSIVMKNDGITLLSWGNNADGQLGIGNTNSPKTLPVLVPAF